MWRMLMVAENRFRRLHAPGLMADVDLVAKHKDRKAMEEQTRRIAS